MPKKKETDVKAENDWKEQPAISSVTLDVYVEKSYTTKVTDTDYAKVVVGVHMPWNPTPEQVETARKTIKVASELVEDELLEEIDKLTGKK